MAFDVLFVLGLFVAPAVIASAVVGLLALALDRRLDDRHPAARRVLGRLLVVGCLTAGTLGVLVLLNLE